MYAIILTAAKVHEKNNPLHSSRCPVVGEAGVGGKMVYIQKRKKELNRFSRDGRRFCRMWLLTRVRRG